MRENRKLKSMRESEYINITENYLISNITWDS